MAAWYTGTALLNGVSPDHLASSDDWLPVTPSDSADLTYISRMISVTVSGVLVVTTLAQADGQTRTLTVPAGTFPVHVKRIWSTNTTATGISYLP